MKLRFLAVLASLTLITACDITSDQSATCTTSHPMATTAVTGPDTTTVNTPITLDVKFVIANSCGVFKEFISSTTGLTTTLVVQVDYIGCQCNPTVFTGTRPYTFSAATPGTYELKFLTDTATPITKTIIVTAG